MIEIDGKLCMWTIYDSPADAAGYYVARLFVLDQPTTTAFFHEDIEAVRNFINQYYPGLTCIPRQRADHPSVVEVWL